MARNTSRKPKKKHTITDAILTIILIAAVGVFCYAGYNLIHIYLEYKKGVDEYNKIADMVVTEQDPDAPAADNGEGDIVDMETLKPPMKIDFETLKQSNEDVIGWIYVEAKTMSILTIIICIVPIREPIILLERSSLTTGMRRISPTAIPWYTATI